MRERLPSSPEHQAPQRSSGERAPTRTLTVGAAGSGVLGLGPGLRARRRRGGLRALQPWARRGEGLPAGSGRTGGLSAPEPRLRSSGEHEWVSGSRGSGQRRLGLRRGAAQLHHRAAGPRQRGGDGAHLRGPARLPPGPTPLASRRLTPSRRRAHQPPAPPVTSPAAALLGGGGEGCRQGDAHRTCTQSDLGGVGDCPRVRSGGGRWIAEVVPIEAGGEGAWL